VKKTTNQYCQDLLGLEVTRSRALANLVMALSSQKGSSATSLSESGVYHYQYSSICDAVNAIASDADGLLAFERQVLGLLLNGGYWSVPEVVYLATDKTVAVKAHSPTLADRSVIALPNSAIKGRALLSVGYEYSWVNVQVGGSWSLPLSARRVGLSETGAEAAGRQVSRLLRDKTLGLKDIPLIVNILDSGYGGSGYLHEVKDVDNLVSCLRLRGGCAVWQQAGAEEQKAHKVPKIYGQRYDLMEQSGIKHYKKHPKTGLPYEKHHTSILDKTPEEDCRWQQTLKNGKTVEVRARCFKNLIFRAHNGVRMDDKPCNVVVIELRDPEHGQLVFKKPLYLGFFGPKKDQCPTGQALQTYRLRYLIEHFFHFAKQNMFMDKYQTPDPQHLDNWMYVVILACWLLYQARTETQNQPKKWQKYNPREKTAPNAELSICQTHKAVLPYLLTFDKTPFLPPKSKGGPGRKKGECQPQRTKYKYVKKSTIKATKIKNRAP
jgi:hypothetical protein